MSQAELAEKADISKTTIALISANKFNPTIEIMSKISEALSIPLYLFFMEENNKCVKKELKDGKILILAVLSKVKAFQVEKWHNSK